jgi:chromate reductase, NAD(P)H dehydrogenase (quinone)
MEVLEVLAVCGSVREGSLNRRLVDVAAALAGDGIRVRVWEEVLPRVDATPGRPLPPLVDSFREAVAGADLLLLATPEFNRSLPGYMKDVVDWLSIPSPPRPLVGKAIALMSASRSPFGGGFAQEQLAAALRRVGGEVVTNLDAAIGRADIELADPLGEETRRRILDLWRGVRDRAARLPDGIPA